MCVCALWVPYSTKGRGFPLILNRSSAPGLGPSLMQNGPPLITTMYLITKKYFTITASESVEKQLEYFTLSEGKLASLVEMVQNQLFKVFQIL